MTYVHSNWGDVDVLLSLDSEPDLWANTHAEVHPEPLTYAELLDRTTTSAAAVKDTPPGGKVLGFVSDGFAGYETVRTRRMPTGAGSSRTFSTG